MDEPLNPSEVPELVKKALEDAAGLNDLPGLPPILDDLMPKGIFNIDFPKLLQTLNQQDEQFRKFHMPGTMYPGKMGLAGLGFNWGDFKNTWSELNDDRDFQNIWSEEPKVEFFPGPKYDWEGLRDKLANMGGMRNKSILAVMPKYPPPTIMTGTSPGIEPVREMCFVLPKQTGKTMTFHRGKVRNLKDNPKAIFLAPNFKEKLLLDELNEDNGVITIHLTQSKTVWDFLNGFQFREEHYIENEQAETFDLELYKADHDDFVTGILDEVGLDAFKNGVMPRLLG